MKIVKQSDFAFLRKRRDSNRKFALVFALVGILALIFGTLTTGYFGFFGFFAGIILLAESFRFYRGSTYYSYGIEGEKAVIETLKELDDSYYLINDIMLGERQGNIDHIIISPKGIFVIETKNYSGTIRCYRDEWEKKGRRGFYPIGSASKQVKGNAVRLRNVIAEGTQSDIYIGAICVLPKLGLDLEAYEPTVPVLRLHELVPYVKRAYPATNLSDAKIQKIIDCVLPKRENEDTA